MYLDHSIVKKLKKQKIFEEFFKDFVDEEKTFQTKKIQKSESKSLILVKSKYSIENLINL